MGEDWLARMRWELMREPRLLRRAGSGCARLTPRGYSADLLRALRSNLRWERATFQLHFAALRQFLHWSGNGLAERKSVWSLPSAEPRRRRWLSREQLLRLYEVADGPARILVGLEGLNGLRRVEVLRLRVRDVLSDEGLLHVRGKGGQGGKWRKIPLHPSVQQDLVAWVRGRGDDDRILPYSRSGADRILARARERLGPDAPPRVSHHDLRRTFGRLAHEAGMDLVQLKNLLGHASVEMSVHYIGLDAARMREGLGRFARYLDGAPPRTRRRGVVRRAPSTDRPARPAATVSAPLP